MNHAETAKDVKSAEQSLRPVRAQNAPVYRDPTEISQDFDQACERCYVIQADIARMNAMLRENRRTAAVLGRELLAATKRRVKYASKPVR